MSFLDNRKYNTIIALSITIASLLVLFSFLNILTESQEQQITGKVIQPPSETTPRNIIFPFFIFTTIFAIIFVGTKLYISLNEY